MSQERKMDTFNKSQQFMATKLKARSKHAFPGFKI